MSAHPFANVVLAAGFNTPQARVLPDHDGFSICLDAVLGVLEESGLPAEEVEAIYGDHATHLLHALGLGPAVGTLQIEKGLMWLRNAVNAVAVGECRAAVVVMGDVGLRPEHDTTAPWTRPQNEFTAPFGLHTAVEFALIASRHMHVFGTRPEHLAEVAATIRNNGHVNPDAVYFGRGPYTPQDILDSRMIAEPFHLLDCAMTAGGAAAVLVTTADRARDLELPGIYVLGTGADCFAPTYSIPPMWDLRFRGPEDLPNGYIGRRAARRAFAMSGITREDVDVFEFYDPYSFEIIRQFEAYEFCEPGEGPDFVMDGQIGPDGAYPTTTDGGLLSFSHCMNGQMLQRVIRGMHQIQGRCATNQIDDASVAMCTAGGAGAMFAEVYLLGGTAP